MMKLLQVDEIGKLINVSARTIRRAMAAGLPVAKIQASKTGGKPQNFFNPDDVKNWYLENKPGTKTSKYILDNCPPKFIKSIVKKTEEAAITQAVTFQAQADEVLRDTADQLANNKSLSGGDLASMAARLADMEQGAHELYKSHLKLSNIKGANFSATTLALLEQSYTRIAARRQSFEEKLPKIMAEKKLYCNTDVVNKILTRLFIEICSKLDRQGFKLAEKLVEKDALTIKAMIDAENGELRNKMIDDLKDYIGEEITGGKK